MFKNHFLNVNFCHKSLHQSITQKTTWNKGKRWMNNKGLNPANHLAERIGAFFS